MAAESGELRPSDEPGEHAVRAWIELSRPTHWVKNLALCVAPLFGRALGASIASGALPWTFATFCAFASAGYAINDRIDVAADREHADKRRRPYARGAVHGRTVIAIALFWIVVGGICSSFAERVADGVLGLALAYVVATVAYSALLKRVFVLDVLVLAGLFVLRIDAGARAAGVPVSPWLAVCSVLGACVVGFGKRLAEVDRNLAVFEPGSVGLTRATLLSYRQSTLKVVVLGLIAALACVYTAYTVAAGTTAQFGAGRMPWTLPFALAGLGRYAVTALMRSERIEDPARLLWTDRWLAGCAIGWSAVAAWAVSGGG